MNWIVLLAGLSGAIAVGAGAFGAHGASGEAAEWLKTGGHYQLIHAVAALVALQLGARGCRLVVRGLRLSRDIHYTQYGEHGTRHPAVLGPREYYVLGDNSGNSQDSRKWPTPGVPEDDFIGKPFLVHQPLRLGRVSVGGRDRAFQTLDWSRLRWLH